MKTSIVSFIILVTILYGQGCAYESLQNTAICEEILTLMLCGTNVNDGKGYKEYFGMIMMRCNEKSKEKQTKSLNCMKSKEDEYCKAFKASKAVQAEIKSGKKTAIILNNKDQAISNSCGLAIYGDEYGRPRTR